MKSKFLVFLTVISMLFGIFLGNISYAQQIDTQENIDITSLENETEQVDTGSIESSSVDTKEETEIINNTQQEDGLDNKEITSQTDETPNEEGISTKEEETSIINNEEEDVIVDNLDDSEEPEESESDDFKDELDQEKDIVIEGSKEEPIIIETEIIETGAPIYELNRNVIPRRDAMDVSETITDLEIKSTNNSNTFIFSLSFSENEDIKYIGGDFIEANITFPDGFNNINIESYKAQEKLLHDGKLLANLTANGSNLTIEFTENVSEFTNIKGGAKFYVTFSNIAEDNEPKEVIINGEINKDINLTTDQPQGPSQTGTDFVYDKEGVVRIKDSNKIEWFININRNKIAGTNDSSKPYFGIDSSANDILTITDSIPEDEDQYIDTKSLKIDLASYDGKEKILYFNSGSFEISDPLFKGIQIISFDKNGFKIEIPYNKIAYNRVRIMYDTILENDIPGKTYSNTAKFEWGRMQQSDNKSNEVKSIKLSGWISGDLEKNQLGIKKYLNYGNKKINLEDVTFQLFDNIEDANEDKNPISTKLTDENGEAIFENLKEQKYYLKEISAPEGVIIDGKIHEVDIKFKDGGNKIDIENEIEKTSITVNKAWKNIDKEQYDDKSITVSLTGLPEEFKDNIITEVQINKNNDWKYTFKNLPKYDELGKQINYSVEEKQLQGFITSYEKLDDNNITITNTKEDIEKTSITVNKVWKNIDKEEYDDKSITVSLTGLPEEFKDNIITEVQINKNNYWKHTFENLPKYDELGKEIKYSVEEKQLQGFISSYSELDDENTITITNTKEQPEDPPTEGPNNPPTEEPNNPPIGEPITPNPVEPEKPTVGNIRIIKKWDGKVGESVSFMLGTKGGSIFRPIELNKDNKVSNDETIWEKELSLNIRDENGNPIEFTLSENHIDGYSSDIKFNLNDDKTLESIVVTNTEEKDEEPEEEPKDRPSSKPKDKDRDRGRDRDRDDKPKEEPILEIEQSKPISLVDRPKEEPIEVEDETIEEEIVEEPIEVLEEVVEEPIKEAQKEVKSEEVKLPKTGNKDYNIFYYLGFMFLILGIYLSKNNKKIK